MNTWTVWVGGTEVTAHLLTRDEAQSVAQRWQAKGYEDVAVAQYNEDKES